LKNCRTCGLRRAERKFCDWKCFRTHFAQEREKRLQALGIRRCRVCGRILRIRRDETASRFAARVCCSRVVCRSTRRRRAAVSRCEMCGRRFPHSGARVRRYCSTSCFGRHKVKRRAWPRKVCEMCGLRFSPPKSTKYVGAIRQQFCSSRCSSRFRGALVVEGLRVSFPELARIAGCPPETLRSRLRGRDIYHAMQIGLGVPGRRRE
jgi:hypothetical protein